MFQMKLAINNPSVNGVIDWKQLPAWKKPPPKRLDAYKVRCFIFQCKDIPSADDDGSSDCYIKVWTPEKEKIQTCIIPDNNNPIFMKTLEFPIEFTHLETAPPIFLNVFDSDGDSMFDGDDFLGRAIIELKDCSLSEEDKIPDPRWHKLVLGFDKDTAAMGEVLCSFCLVPTDFKFEVATEFFKLEDKIPYKEQEIEINILGLRNLQSLGLFPVNKAYIRFNLKSLLPPDKAKAVENVDTTPNEKGENPNINTLMSFNLSLPVQKIYCPVM